MKSKTKNRVPSSFAAPADNSPVRVTRCTMNRCGGMAVSRGGEVTSIGRSRSRFRLLSSKKEPALDAHEPTPFRTQARPQDERLVGLPPLRFQLSASRQQEGMRRLGPSTSRFRMQVPAEGDGVEDVRFRMAGRGGPKVMLSEDEE